MGLETGNYISALVKTNPLSSDNVSEGDDHLQLIKKILKQTFPAGTDSEGPDQVVQILVAKATAPTVDTSASGHAARAMGLLWLDTTNNVLKIRNQANSAWVTLAVDPETSNSVDINAGTIDGAVIGGTTPAAVTTSSLVATTADINGGTVDGTTVGASSASTGAFTTVTTTGTLTVGTDITISGDDIIMATNTDAYMLVADGSSYNPVAISGDITITNAGVTSIGADKVITAKILDANVTNAKLANMAANTIKVRNANSSGVPSDLALATTEIIIGDGTGFTAAALSGDATMTNAGAVSVTGIQGQSVSATAATNDQYLKYSSASSEWQKVDVVAPDRLTTKGDLLVYNTVDSETRLPVGANDLVLTADSTATNGVDWAAVSVADGTITNAKMADMAANTVKVRDAASSGVPSDKTVADTQILIGDGTGFTAAALSGDATMTNAGVVAIGTGVIVDADINGSAAIDATKIANGTVTSTEFQYINTLSSNAQTQIDAKGVGDAVKADDASWTGSQRATTVTDNDGSFSMDAGQNFICTPSGNFDLTFTAIANGQSGFIKLINSGGHTVSLATNSKADANLATTVSTAGTYLLSYFSDGTDVWLTNSAIYA
jgi:hypothetical protein